MHEIATVTSPGLNLHEDPSKGSHIIDTLTLNDKLDVISRDGSWLKGRVIATKSGRGLGQVGWVHGDFVQVARLYEPAPLPKPSYALGAAVILMVFVILAALAYLFVPQ